jgi:hypothetical protein
MTSFFRSRRIVGAFLLAGLTFFAPNSAASAHTDLVSTSPVADSEINASQESISLTFAEPMLVEGAAIVVMDSTGATLSSPSPTQIGSTLSIPWPADLTPGLVTVQWRATGDDGHVLSGDFAFNYTAAAEGGMAPSPLGSVIPADQTAMATPEATPMLLGAAYVPEESNNNLVIGIAILSLVGLVAAGLFLRRTK